MNPSRIISLLNPVFRPRPHTPRLYPHLPRTVRAILLEHNIPAADTHETARAIDTAARVCDALAAHADPTDLFTRALFQQAAQQLHHLSKP